MRSRHDGGNDDDDDDDDDDDTGGAASGSIAECILDSSPVFEAFGNAKTLRNSNSSRFGKFISLQFDPSKSYTLTGAFVTTYLLEKTRVCYHHHGERCYHIFYDMIGGGSADGKGKQGGAADVFKDLCLAGFGPRSFRYLRSSAGGDDGVEDEEERRINDQFGSDGDVDFEGTGLLGTGDQSGNNHRYC